MHTNPLLTEKRAERMLREHVSAALHRQSLPLELSGWEVPDEPVSFQEAMAQDFAPTSVGTAWGAPWRTLWLRATGTVPAQWREVAGTEVELVVDLGFTDTQPGFQAEGLLMRADGSIIKAVSPRNQTAPWAAEPDRIEVYIEAAANPDVAGGFGFAPTPYGRKSTAGQDPLYRLRRVDVALRDLEVDALAADLGVLLELAAALPLDSTRRALIDEALDRATDLLDPRDIAGTAARARAELAGVLARPAHASAHHVLAVGHAHIDSAWLWPTRETVRKCVRTFSSVLALMDTDPDFVFACSSAQQYLWVKQARPDLYARIKERVAQGRFVPVGGMWLESDTNMPGSEALARQIIEGKGFFLEEFGVETLDAWLPDSFGYSGSLPQIIRAAGSRWFLSQKMSWNEVNRFPHHTFTWEGIDGSRVLTHFPPADTYGARLSVDELRHAESNFADKRVASSSIVPFGYGDGGGGPTREMLAAAHRFADLEGVPTVELASPNTFFERTESQAGGAGGLPVWSGEMYLEFHRGTYTSQLRTKQGNRRSEHLLREAELWAATAAVREGLPYPYEEIKECWHTVLRNQFHDILPGTSIGWVYEQTEREYSEVSEALEAIIARSAAALVGEGSRPLRLNAAPVEVGAVPSLGIGTGRPATGRTATEQVDGGAVLDNGLLRVSIDAAGLITSVIDLRADREVLSPGARAGLLQLHRDVPRQWDAWDIDAEYRRMVEDIVDVQVLTVEQDGADGVVRIERRLGEASRLTEEIRLPADATQVVFDLDVDWHERQRLLKLAFPLDLMAESSTSEMQFGHVSRPTHQNTSWDAARYEICAHRWIHVGEPGYGTAVLNDSTYGHDVTRGLDELGRPSTVVRLSLLRAPLFPDPEADQGRHRLRVALRPGARIEEAVAEGYVFNLPDRVVTGDHEVEPLVSVEGRGVVVEAVKLAEDRSGDVVVRLYESLGARTRARVTPGFPAGPVRTVDLLERDVAGPALEAAPEEVRPGLDETGPTTSFEMRPFQIVTLRIPRA
ncbi:MAG: glycoside hydrolase family 38 C-terminal domain-containing protein [Actinomyces sp.]|uniref:alpha-mannosidase n=1 Tax=Actinomyces sp. TaxID=29317 RepID=UPI0026DB6A85|nr:glycoside hydrolase family 38 C-terminal domain-containing protein [Actinomyces sp.]MDO4242846.1 glycoside hydrolase family 38 C-terminal domain-containing protein [Actinomyces sp.]